MRSLKRLLLVIAVILLLLTALHIYARFQLPAHRDALDIAAELEAKIAAVEAIRWPRPPLFDEPVGGTAWDHYRLAAPSILAAGESLSEAEREEAEDALDRLKDPKAPILESLKTLLLDAEEGWASVRHGVCAREAGRGFSPRSGTSSEDPDWDLGVRFPRRLRDLATARAVLLAREDPDQSLETLQVLHRFGEDLPGGGGVREYGMGIEVRGRAIDMAGRLVAAGLTSDEMTGRVLTWLSEIPTRELDPLAVADAEMLHFLKAMEHVGEGRNDSLIPDMPFPMSLRRRKLLYRVLDLHREAYARARAGDRGVAAVREEFLRTIKGWRPWLALAGELRALLLVKVFYDLPGWGFCMIEREHRRIRAKKTAVILLIHACRLHAENGWYPASLEEIVAFAGVEVPAIDEIAYEPDPETGEPIFFWIRDLEEHEDGDSEPPEPLARVNPD
jgi:hypothetical protein